MAVIKCKMCGGDLALPEGQSVAECEYCGSRQTVPAADNEKKLTLFARANRLRAACEFDKAAGIYETIAAEFPEEAESYWGLVLCKYGIEYVDDPAAGKKIPTCHRLSFDSVMDDGNFDQAMENADQTALRVYRQEAKQIEEIRRGILEVSSSEKPYDIFICYKETDENGDRTVDSLLAQDIYDALTSKGYRVFFSRITLEDKLGQAYEPYIFAALNSAKIMLAVGTCYEHYNAVWVKNEWSRYLKIIAQDKNKYLIPCYKNIDAYDIPREFAHLQGQDMGKVGAIADLLRGIEKLIPREKPDAVAVQERIVVGGNTGSNKIASLLDRGNMALEDGDWDKADSFFEDVLNNDSKNSQAYLGKALAQHRCRTMDALVRKRKETAMNVPRATLELQADTSHIREMAKKYSLPGYLEEVEIRRLYDFDLKYPSEVSGWEKRYGDEVEYWATHKLLFRAEQFADENMLSMLLEYRSAVYDYIEKRQKEAEKKESDCRVKLEAEYAAHIAESDRQAELLYRDALSRREQAYEQWREQAQTVSSPELLTELACCFDGLKGYKDSNDLAGYCRKRAGEERAKYVLEREQQREIEEQRRKEKKKRRKRNAVIFAVSAALAAAAILLTTKVILPEKTYQEAIALRDSGDYMGAVRTFRKIQYYKDVQEQLEDFTVVYTKKVYASDSGKYREEYTYDYGEDGNLLSVVNINRNGDRDQTTHSYDENGNRISSVTKRSGGFVNEYTYGYDKNGNQISMVHTDAGGEEHRTSFTYDENGRMISKTETNDDKERWYYTYFYDTDGNLVREAHDYSGPSGRSSYEYRYTYKGGNLVHKKELRENGEVYIWVDYTYDRKGNLLTETGENWGDGYEITYTYDKHGNPLQKRHVRYDGSIEREKVDMEYMYFYTYDENGNLTREEQNCRKSRFNDHWDGSRDHVYGYDGYRAFYCPKDSANGILPNS